MEHQVCFVLFGSICLIGFYVSKSTVSQAACNVPCLEDVLSSPGSAGALHVCSAVAQIFLHNA